MENTDISNKCPAVVEYAEETTFHGLKYIFRAKQTIIERSFWILLLITLGTGFGYFVYGCISRYVQFPVNIQESIKFEHIFELPFPAVTVCPANKIQNFNLNALIQSSEFSNSINNNVTQFWNTPSGLKLIMATQVCQKSLSDTVNRMLTKLEEIHSVNFTKPTEYYLNMTSLLFEMSPSLPETIYECQLANWHDNEVAVSSSEIVEKLFKLIITNEGLCFTFNTISDVLKYNERKYFYQGINIRDGWDPETGYSKHEAYPFKAIVRGNDGKTGLKIDLTANLSGRTEFCNPSNLGYKIILHSPSSYPNTYGQFISIDYGKDYMIAINPEVIRTANSLRSIRPEIRQCYFNDERQLKYYTFYNENNCKLECYANYTLQMYGGVPFSAPRDYNIPFRILKSFNYGWHMPNYYGSIYDYNKIYKNMISVNATTDMDCNCLPECNSIQYDYTIISKNMNVMESIRNVSGRNEAESIVEIMFIQPTFLSKERIAVYTFATLVSDFGGLLGLFMGGSIISMFELFYFLVIRKFFRQK